MVCYVKEKVDDAYWWNGTLFVATEQELKCIFALRDTVESVVLASFGMLQYAGFSKNSEEHSVDPVPQPRPRGSLGIVSVIDDELYVMDSRSILYNVNLDHAVLKFRMLVAAGRVDQALEWLPYIPEEIHDQLASFMAEMSFEHEACRLETISAPKKLSLCMKYRMAHEAFQTVQFIDQEQQNFLLSSQQVAKLYLRLASMCASDRREEWMNIATKCYHRAGELDLQHFNSYISYLSSLPSRESSATQMQHLKTNLLHYHADRSDSRLYNEQMSLLCMLLATRLDGDEARRRELQKESLHYMQQAQQIGLSILSSTGSDSETFPAGKWHEWLENKYGTPLELETNESNER